MSKNTGTSELINYFDLGANGDVGIAGSLDVNTIANATTDTDKFLVSDTGIIKYRTGAELLTDIGAAPAVAGGYVPYTGATTNVDLGVYNLTTSAIIANGSGSNSGIVHLESNAIHSLVNGYGSIASGTTNQFNLYQTTGAGVFRGAILSLNSITEFATRTFTLPNTDGTIALTSQIPANAVGGTGTSGTIPVFTGSTTLGNSIIQSNATQVNIVGNGSSLLFDSLGSAKDGGIQYINDFTLQIYNSRGVGSAIYLGNNNLDLNISPSSNPRLRITSGGNVLINTTTDAGYKLDVNGTGRFSGAVANPLHVETSGADGGIQIYRNVNSDVGSAALFMSHKSTAGVINTANIEVVGSGSMLFRTGATGLGNFGTTRLTISPTGAATFSSSVTATTGTFNSTGIGVFNSQIVARNTTSASALITFENTANGHAFGFSSTGAAGQRFSFINGAPTEIAYITSSGAATFSSSVTARNGLVSWSAPSSANLLMNDLSGNNKWEMGYESTSNNFYIYSYSGGISPLRITSSGNVLIGTTTDAGFKLDVAGTGRFIGPNASGRGQLSIQSNNASNGARVTWYYDTTLQGEIGTTSGDFYALAVNNFLFYAGGAERMRINTGFSVSVPNATFTTLFDIASVLTVGSTGIVNVYASSGSGLGVATLIIMRDGIGGVSQAQIGIQPTANYLSFQISGTNLQVFAAISAGTHTIQGTVVRISS